MLERPNICYIFEKLGVQDVKYDIPMCQSHSTRPHNAKKLFTSSFQAIFLKIGFTKVTCTCSFLCTCTFWSSHCSQVPRHIWAKLWHNVTPLTPKKWPKMAAYELEIFLEPLVSRYGRLKLKFLFEQFSHCIYSFCSTELTKSRNTWSLKSRNTWRLTAVPQL